MSSLVAAQTQLFKLANQLLTYPVLDPDRHYQVSSNLSETVGGFLISDVWKNIAK